MNEQQHSGRKGWSWTALSRSERIALLAAAVGGASTALADKLASLAAHVMLSVFGG